ncbi:MAG TPA: hypothetical protein PKV27_01290 [Ilumatobacteraceae bacterium]|nr:hypothetical protein [Ilumatobacteraceae bacterium]
MRTGSVTEFDVWTGLGVITLDNDAPVSFHCVAITDGTRRIDVGQPVVAALSFHLGRQVASVVHKR